MTYENFCLKLLTRVNDGHINYNNHTMDNGFLDADVRQMWRNMEHNQQELLGISFSPPYWVYSKYDMALVFKDWEYNEVYWIHLPRLTWEDFIIQILSEEKGNETIEQIYSWFKKGDTYD